MHCLHRGGSNHAFLVGLFSDYIKLMGDWGSDAYLDYRKINLEHRVEVVVHFMYACQSISSMNWNFFILSLLFYSQSAKW